MRALALAVFATSLGAVVWVYFGYPALIWLLARRRPWPVQSSPVEPSLSVLVPAFDEEAVIDEKVRNTLFSGYPASRLEVIVASDGSTDRTEEIVARLERDHPDHVRLLRLPRQGKAAAIDAAARAARGEVIVLTDANALLATGALHHLVAPFADPEVGGVCGRKRLRSSHPNEGAAEAVERGEGLYWRYDQWVKAQESRAGCVFAADGALYALRRELYVPMADPAQADDIAISARVVLQGWRLVWAPEAVVWEEAPEEGAAELRRKVRVTNHSVRALWNLGPALWRSGFYSVQLLSHKFFRHLVPFFLLALLAAHVALAASSPAFAALLVPHLGFYALAAAGMLLRGAPAGRARLLSVPYYFTLVNLAAFLGVVSILRGERRRAWNPRRGLET